jgi:hypothetical protein
VLNTTSYEGLMGSTAEAAKLALSAKWSEGLVSFGNMDSFPKHHGVYFVFFGEEVVYVGKADKQTIAKRCKQYVGSSSGATLRKKVECVWGCSGQDAVEFIKANMQARFMRIDDVEQIPVIEEIAIWAFQSRLNAIKPEAFTYERLIL